MAYTMTQLEEFFTNANAGTGPNTAQKLALQGILNDNLSGVSNDDTFAKVVDLASDDTLAVSVGTYNFFLGYAPSQAGLAALNAAYVASGAQANLNGENRFIAQSVALALQNATAKASFSASYGSMSVEAATKAAYLIIIGQTAADAANINVDSAVAYLASAQAQAYYRAFIAANIPGISDADLDLAVKAAIVGEILYQATKYDQGAGIGSYAQATTNLVKDLALDNVLTNDNVSGIDLLGKYGSTSNNGSSLVLTGGVDTITGTTGDDTITGLVDATAGATPTFTALDTIAGGAGNDTLVINAITALGQANINAVTVTGIETVNLRSASTVTADVSAWTDVTALNVTQATAATVAAGSDAAIGVSGVTGAITIDGGASVTVNDTTAGNAITIGGTTTADGVIAVTDSNQTTGAITIDGGSDVTVAASKVTTGTIDIGGATAPTGAVTVTSTGSAYVAAGSVTHGAINVDGGTKVSVTQTAASDLSAQAKDGAVGTITQSAVTVNGTSDTTEVTVSQSAAVTGQNYVAAAGGKEVQTVTFVAMAAGETIVVNGLTFTASKALTAAEAAAAFANLAAGATTGSAPVTNGYYTGTFNTLGFTSGAVTTASGVSTVTLTGSANGNLAAATVSDTAAAGNVSVATVTDGVASVTGKAGIAAIVGGAVAIDGNITGADVLATVTLDGYGAGSTVKSDALTTLKLANSDQDVTVTNATATTLGLTLDNVGAAAAAAVALGGTYSTLNVTVDSDSAADITAAGVQALTVAGAGALDLSGATLAALKTVTVSGAAGVTIDASGATVTSVNASATSGDNTVTLDATKATYTGGTGSDDVTLSAAAPTKAVSLGDGDDSLTLASGTTSSTGTLSGGNGTDTLVMDAADAVAASSTATFEGKFTGFEHLSLNAVGANGTVDMSNMNDISYVISAGGGAFDLTLDNFAANGTVVLTGAVAAGGSTIVSLADDSGSSDVLNLVTTNSGSINVQDVDATGIETVNLTATDTKSSTLDTHTVNIIDADLKTLTVGGNAKVVVTYDSTALTSVNASANTGGVTVATLAGAAAATTVTGGTGADTLTGNHNNDVLLGGDGADSLVVGANLLTLTGGAGADSFNVSFAVSSVNGYATITDAAAGDKLVFANTASAETFTSAKVALADTAVFQDYANEAINTTDQGDIVWFQFGGNTYVIEHASADAATSFVNGTDVIVKLTGLVDLSTASFSDSALTLVIH